MKSGKSAFKYVVGIDEVGRGPIAGPVTVGAVLMPQELSWGSFKGLKDSKQLSPQAREAWFVRIKAHPDIRYVVSSVSERIIDTRGIVPAINLALQRSLQKLEAHPDECLVLLDGGLRAPEAFVHQETIIKGDEKECAIALASIAAKVTRDRKMVLLGKKYPEYVFESHKGYGTKAHYACIGQHGLCDIHRRSFLKGI